MVTLFLAVALAGPADSSAPELLDFTATWCAPCRAMEPVIKQLQAAGYPVRQVDIDRERRLAEQFRVDRVPCFVLVDQGREVKRIEGSSNYTQLAALFANAPRGTGVQPVSQAARPVAPVSDRVPGNNARIRGQSPDDFRPPAGLGWQSSFDVPPAPVQPNRSPQELAMRATVRLRVHDQGGHSGGTGTIIHAHNNEALVLTCGHVFRDSAGKGRIEVDLFAGTPQQRTVAGRLISCDSEWADLALVAIQPGEGFQPVRLAAADRTLATGERVFSIGCDQGANPSVRTGMISKLNNFTGAGCISVAGQPVVGRSGGGLFLQDGTLIGVCKWASPQDNEGVFSSFSEVHGRLEKAGIANLFRQPPFDALVRGQDEPVVLTPNSPTLPREFPRSSPPAVTPSESESPDELILILRSRGRNEARVLDRLSPALREQLLRELKQQAR